MPRRTEAGEAPGAQGATTENIRLYLREEQRCAPGCIAGRMQRHFHHGLLGAYGSAGVLLIPTATTSHAAARHAKPTKTGTSDSEAPIAIRRKKSGE